MGGEEIKKVSRPADSRQLRKVKKIKVDMTKFKE
jgi:hypothetical protein